MICSDLNHLNLLKIILTQINTVFLLVGERADKRICDELNKSLGGKHHPHLKHL